MRKLLVGLYFFGAILSVLGVIPPAEAAVGTDCDTSSECDSGDWPCGGGNPSTTPLLEGECKGPCKNDEECVPLIGADGLGWDNAVCTGSETKNGTCIEAPVEGIPLGPQDPDELVIMVRNISNWIFVGFSLFAVVFVILAGYQFVAHGGEPQAVSQARSKLMYAAIGVAIALMARGAEPVIRRIIE